MSHTYIVNIYHIIWHTKDRTNLIQYNFQDLLHSYIGGIIKGLKGKPLKITGTENHIHLLCTIPIDLPTATFVRDIKSNSSKWTKGFPRNINQFAWEDGYHVFSVSEELFDNYFKYLERQKEIHSLQTIEQELERFLSQHQIPYNPDFYLRNTHANQVLHIIWSTKHRYSLIPAFDQKPLYSFIENEIVGYGADLLAIGGITDHIHLLVKIPPKIAVADLIRSVKSNSSKWMSMRSTTNKDFEWQVGYGSFTVSKSIEKRIIEYIDNQDVHHKTKTFAEEWNNFCQKQNFRLLTQP